MTTINIRIEEKTKKAASKALANIGLDLSAGIKMFLHQVVTDKGLPFQPSHTPRVSVAQLDKEHKHALKYGKRYKSAEEYFKDKGMLD